MVEVKDMAKYAVVALGAVAIGGALWWLSKEDDLDYRKYNLEKLKEVYETIELELCCIYARNYAHMLTLKEKKEWEVDMMLETQNTI